jgi:carbonic anhydrase
LAIRDGVAEALGLVVFLQTRAEAAGLDAYNRVGAGIVAGGFVEDLQRQSILFEIFRAACQHLFDGEAQEPLETLGMRETRAGEDPFELNREFMILAATFGPASSRIMTATPPQEGCRRSVNADQALRELLDGNHRFTSGNRMTPRGRPEDFHALTHGQFPEAAVVSCADSRVPPEILFDVGVGDIFVVRVAGNVIGGAGVSVKGSIEYAVAELNVPLILVLGHSGCGAVKSAIKHIDDRDSLPGAISGLVELIKPAVAMSKGMPGDALENAVRKNVEIGVERLQGLEPIVAPRVKDRRVKVVGGVYDLHNGAVTLIDTKK